MLRAGGTISRQLRFFAGQMPLTTDPRPCKCPKARCSPPEAAGFVMHLGLWGSAGDRHSNPDA